MGEHSSISKYFHLWSAILSVMFVFLILVCDDQSGAVFKSLKLDGETLCPSNGLFKETMQGEDERVNSRISISVN